MDELMKALECCVESLCGECPYQKYSDTHYTLRCSHKLIADLAAADLKPERHGRWVNMTIAIVDTVGSCTNCGKEAVWRSRNKPYFICPNCGAKMDLEEEV